MKSELEHALDYDALDTAERITGLSYKKTDAVAFLGMALMQENNAKKDALLAETADTHWGQTFSEWIGTVEAMGFKEMSSEKIEGTEDEFKIFWRDGILLTVESYCGGKSVNSAKAYFNYKGPRNAMRHCSNGFAGGTDEAPIWEGSYDSREGLKFTLEKMQAEGEFLKAWVKQPFLWLLTYRDTKEEDYTPKKYDYTTINKRRIENLPSVVQAAILG